MEDYTIQEIYNSNNILSNDYILHNNFVFKIRHKKYSICQKMTIAITYTCYNFLETKKEFIKYNLNEFFSEYKQFKNAITKIIFNIKTGTFVDYDDIEDKITFLDEESNLIEYKYIKFQKKYNIYDVESQSFKYIKFNDEYNFL